MEGILSSHLGNVFVSGNTGSFEGLRADLLSLQGDQMEAEGELISKSFLPAKIIDTDLSVWHTTAITRLGVRSVFAISVTPRRT